MHLADLDSETCSIARTSELTGDRWTLLVLRDLFNGIRRFDALRDHLGVSRQVLSDRLARLTDADFIERRPYRVDRGRERHEYVLTAAGRDLRTLLVALMDFGDVHLSGAAGPPMTALHRGCGAPVHARLVCDAGHHVQPVDRTDVVPLAGALRRDNAP